MSELNVSCSQDLRDQVLTVEPTNKMPALICRCLQALAEALKINKCVMNFISYDNQIGAEGAKAWCLVGSAVCRGMSWCHFPDILWQWEVWMVWRCCSFIIHLSSRGELSNLWMLKWNCGFLDCSCKGSIREILHVLVKLNVLWLEDFRSTVLCVGPSKSRRQPWSVAASRPWPRHCRSTSPSRTSICNTTRLAPRVPRPGVWWASQNTRWMLRHVLMSFFDSQ